ncbi:MAG TPA: site-specific DNA-methyltransferase [Thermoplasmata archaeon]|jgi:site-specific DNA-methyltransferase (adenine-specific)
MTYLSGDGVELIVGDCREVLKTLHSESFQFIFTDPPYRIKNWEGFGRKANRTYGTKPPEYHEWLSECYRVLKSDGSINVCESTINIKDLWLALEKAGFQVQPPLAWFVSFRASHPRRGWLNSHWEPVMWGTKTEKWYFDSKPLAGKGSSMGGDVYVHPSINYNAIVPGQKPIGLSERQIRIHTKEGDKVLDPFAGSSTTLKAARKWGRYATGIEINPEIARKGFDLRAFNVRASTQTEIHEDELEKELGDGKVNGDKIH